MPDGHLLLLLHAHLPFVRHPEEPVFLEESWLFEAITECYIPLLERCDRLDREGAPVRLTMTWSPPLCEMLADPMLQERYRHHAARLLELAEQEVPAKAHTPFAAAAVHYRDHLRYCLHQFARWGGNILGWVRELAERGVIEPITCGATHGFLPLMRTREAQRAQLAVATANYRKHFGRAAAGIWLAECGYAPGLEELLKEHGLRFFFLDTHGLWHGTPRPRYGVYAPAYTPCGVAAYAREVESGRQVWSQQAGYPGDPLYREFYRDLGHDGEYPYIRGFLHPDGVRRNLGLKYHRITGRVGLHEKQPWEPAPAYAQAFAHGADFVRCRRDQCRHLASMMGRVPLIVAPYDAELFGHWWYEGPAFIEGVLRAAHADGTIATVTGSGYLDEHPAHQVVQPVASSWGDHGHYGVWLNPSNDWMYRHLHVAEERMRQVARLFNRPDPVQRRYANQMGRELLLAQSSDWAFIMTTGTSPSYARRRFHDHINRFTSLFEQLVRGVPQHQDLHEMEWRDSIFQELDFRVWA